MEFGLSKEHLLAQQLYRSFAEKEVKPLAHELDEEEKKMEQAEKVRFDDLFTPADK